MVVGLGSPVIIRAAGRKSQIGGVSGYERVMGGRLRICFENRKECVVTGCSSMAQTVSKPCFTSRKRSGNHSARSFNHIVSCASKLSRLSRLILGLF